MFIGQVQMAKVKQYGLLRHKQICLMKLHFERYFPHHRAYDGRNVASLSILVHDIINLLYYSVACVLIYFFLHKKIVDRGNFPV